tara:strand:- start:2934 stop:3266 length:333 start_codon:yes stop_codon:yes gene_type:complete
MDNYTIVLLTILFVVGKHFFIDRIMKGFFPIDSIDNLPGISTLPQPTQDLIKDSYNVYNYNFTQIVLDSVVFSVTLYYYYTIANLHVHSHNVDDKSPVINTGSFGKKKFK